MHRRIRQRASGYVVGGSLEGVTQVGPDPGRGTAADFGGDSLWVNLADILILDQAFGRPFGNQKVVHQVFASENPNKPLWRDNVWYRHMKPKLETAGLGWANFQVLRRTHASLRHDIKVDPKVAADQRGHSIGVALDVYTQSSIEARRAAAEMLANAVLSGEQPEMVEAEPETNEENRSEAA